MTDYPILCQWDGDVLRPISWAQRRWAREHWILGKTYPVMVATPRSLASHNHYFAALRAAWENLPEHLAERFPSPEHLRKYALIHTGYRDERWYSCESNEQARDLAIFIKPLDEFAVITNAGGVVFVWTAKSQSRKSMDKAEFQASKDAVLDLVSAMIGVTKDELMPRSVASIADHPNPGSAGAGAPPAGAPGPEIKIGMRVEGAGVNGKIIGECPMPPWPSGPTDKSITRRPR